MALGSSARSDAKKQNVARRDAATNFTFRSPQFAERGIYNLPPATPFLLREVWEMKTAGDCR